MTNTAAPAELPKQYDHTAAQDRWYAYWQAQGYFHSEPNPERQPYTIVIPPPNVTGALHLGHALNGTLQDIMIRMKRMQGFETLWMPGTDHAGIATQAVVERRLLEEEGKTRHDLGREALVKRIWQWKESYQKRIIGQLKQMGCSCDWERLRFTLDETCARAVRHTFFRMFADGKIFRGKRLVNWDTFLQTAVSDDEVFRETVEGHFWHFSYKVIDPKPGEPEKVTIATTRPETMLGDTAVAVHPNPAKAFDKVTAQLQEKLAAAADKDKADVESQIAALAEQRKKMLSGLEQLRDMARDGRQVMLPLVDRPIPLIVDEWAKPELGSGCVKITPAHDPNDYEVGRRNPEIGAVNILNSDGTLNENAGPYQGQKMSEGRKNVIADLEELGLMEQIEDREIEIAHSDRSKTPIEPYLADQWFVKMDELAQSAMDAVSDGRVKITPERYAKSYQDWLSEKRDWCISRNLWWGHQIPIWYAPDASEDDLKAAFAGRDDVAWRRDEEHDQWLICAQEEDLADDAVPGGAIRRDPDVLDTWFSSALWPHSTLGWPEETPELAYYYPTSTLITSRDIISLWVARMVLTGLYNRGEAPFRDVYIHPKILDGYGETMSKSKGNGVDPLDVIEKFGTDALRFGLAYMTTEAQDVRMPVEFECPHCQEQIKQTKKNRILPRVGCKKCGGEFSTQWADADSEDAKLPRGAVVSERFELGRNFCNKLWNASRFALLNLEGYTPGAIDSDDLLVEDRWILSRLATVSRQVTEALEAFKFAEAARTLHYFAWDEFCSFYIEMVKGRLQGEETKALAQRVLAYALDALLRLLHPMIPFITEEVWHLLGKAAPQRGLQNPQPAVENVMIAAWPEIDASWHDAEIEARFTRFQEMLKGLREIRSRQTIPTKTTMHFAVRCDEETTALLKPMAPYFASMAGAEATAWGAEVSGSTPSAAFTTSTAEAFVDLAEHMDVGSEIEKNEKEKAQVQGFIVGKEKKLSNESFVGRAPAEVVQRERDSLEELKARLVSLEAALEELRKQL
jgi:valyl-tRNA synthetase